MTCQEETDVGMEEGEEEEEEGEQVVEKKEPPESKLDKRLQVCRV